MIRIFMLLLVVATLSINCKLFNYNTSIKNNDDISYTFIKYSFYKDSIGNLYEKKHKAIDEMNQKIIYFYDSTMFYKKYPHSTALKNIINIETYEEFNDSPFSIDKFHVYYYFANSDGGFRFIVKDANPKTFSPIKDRWAKDDKNIFYGYEKVKKADIKTFTVNNNSQDSAYDKKSVFFNGVKIKSISKKQK